MSIGSYGSRGSWVKNVTRPSVVLAISTKEQEKLLTRDVSPCPGLSLQGLLVFARSVLDPFLDLVAQSLRSLYFFYL